MRNLQCFRYIHLIRENVQYNPLVHCLQLQCKDAILMLKCSYSQLRMKVVAGFTFLHFQRQHFAFFELTMLFFFIIIFNKVRIWFHLSPVNCSQVADSPSKSLCTCATYSKLNDQIKYQICYIGLPTIMLYFQDHDTQAT